MGGGNYPVEVWSSVPPQQTSTALSHTPKLAGIWMAAWGHPCAVQNQQFPQSHPAVFVLADEEFYSIKAASKGWNPESHIFSYPSSPKHSVIMTHGFLQNFKYFTCVVSTLSHALVCHPWNISTALLSILSQLSQYALQIFWGTKYSLEKGITFFFYTEYLKLSTGCFRLVVNNSRTMFWATFAPRSIR